MSSQQRKIPQAPQAAPVLGNADVNTLIYDIKVITPILGGGARPREIDPVSVIRPSSVRGHLRFWWRQTCNTDINDNLKLALERCIFGSTLHKSKLAVKVEIKGSLIRLKSNAIKEKEEYLPWDIQINKENKSPPIIDKRTKCSQLSRYNSAPKYLLGVYSNEAIKFYPPNPSNTFQIALTFNNLNIEEYLVKIKSPITKDQILDQIKQSMTAWINFGGIGSRTRRGCGALFCETTQLTSVEDIEKFNFQNNRLICRRFDFGIDAWYWGIETFMMFRQCSPSVDHGVGRKAKNFRIVNNVLSGKPSTSNWPEATSVRRIIKNQVNSNGSIKTNSFHQLDIRYSKNIFPRAAFGLPITFVMFNNKVDGKSNTSNKSCIQPTLIPIYQGSAHDRLASPLIIRPVNVNGIWHTAFLRLKARNPTAYELRKSPFDLDRNEIINTDAVFIKCEEMKNTPLNDFSNQNSDAIDAFLNYVSERDLNSSGGDVQ